MDIIIPSFLILSWRAYENQLKRTCEHGISYLIFFLRVQCQRESIMENLLKTYDLLLPQALSKRIHYGKFVAEAKFQAAADSYKAAIIAQVQIPLNYAILFVSVCHQLANPQRIARL